ncbi:hypothetical protein CVT25_005511 [Psilocybe cyanescens]|uniref:Nephrocystin 3-like N-terminal domain-containing protein n=1 Tax=Psilocybe cyanescens TaxID=93625 RepID=A0A409X661_PSICY|nr:hypothetical protein CVT25_005511 [Psilocybe cyanescens]
MSQFAQATNFTIHNSTFNTQQLENPKSGFEYLQEYVAHGAFHDSGERFDPPKCHPTTRVAIIKAIINWISGLDEDTRDALIMWLYGAAGAGKSAIAQTIAEILDGQHFILASFFFGRNDPQRGTAKLLVTTLVYQLAVKLPHMFRERVNFVFENDPLIITRSLEAQFKALVREPLLELFHSGYSTDNHLVIIIDGLDECKDASIQARIVDLSFSLLRSRDIPLKILIASRPEIEITSSLDPKPSSMLARIALDDDYQSDHDIRHFLSDTFDDIKNQHPLRAYIPESWPPDDALDILVKRSSGQFIYASTAVKYVASPRYRPTHRLEIVLGIRPPKAGDSPFAELDALYQHILMGAGDVNLILILKIIGFVLLRPPRNDGEISVASVESFFSLDAGDVQLLMQSVGSLISLDERHVFAGPFGELSHYMPCVRILHASLKDFLFDHSRSKDLFLDPPKLHTLYTELCIAHLTTGSTIGIGGFDRLQEYVPHGAFHGLGERFDPPKYHSDTGVAIIRKTTD